MVIKEAGLKFTGPFGENHPSWIIVHHALHPDCTINDVHAWHLANGWVGVGYHYFITREGEIWRGRPETADGAHCKEQDMNDKAIGICLEGCYEEYVTEAGKVLTQKDVPEAQIAALVELTKDIMKRLNIPVTQVAKHAKFATYKLCPGNYFPWDRYVASLVPPPPPVDWKAQFDIVSKQLATEKTISEALRISLRKVKEDIESIEAQCNKLIGGIDV